MKQFVIAVILFAMFALFGVAMVNGEGNAFPETRFEVQYPSIYTLPDPGEYWTPQGRGGMPDIMNVLVWDWRETTPDGKPIQRTTFAYYMSGEKYRANPTVGCVLLHDFYRNGDWLTTNGGSLGAPTEVRCAPWMKLTEDDLFAVAQFNAFIYEQMSMQCAGFVHSVYAMDESAVWGIEEMEAKVNSEMTWGDLDSICNPTLLTPPMRYSSSVGSQQGDRYGIFVVGAMANPQGEPYPWDVLITWERNARGIWEFEDCDVEYLEYVTEMVIPSDTLSPMEYDAILSSGIYTLCEAARNGFAGGTGLSVYDSWLWDINGLSLEDFEQEISEVRPRDIVQEHEIVFVPVIQR